ncbi:MAG: hypothetical protein FWE22_05205 [Firmicutes bacterium]|nr:hypothetical protein [Bacillota bacterium]
MKKNLRQANHIIFCGYSFPDADVHIKSLLLDALYSNKKSLKFTIINGKNNKWKDDEQKRFERIFGKVNYTDLDFQDFAKNPLPILEI